MNYVASHTAIPLPKIHTIHVEQDDRIFIEMAYAQGDSLDGVWKSLASPKEERIRRREAPYNVSSQS